ncbi:MAG: glycerate kinase [Candidatus Bipolaricaulia bacterium]
MKIKNRTTLLKSGPTRPKKAAVDLFEEGINSALPGKVIRDYLRVEGDSLFSGEDEYDLTAIDRVLVVGGGKASFGMAKAAESVLNSIIDTGLIVTKRGGMEGSLEKVRIREASHPVPDLAGVKATGELLEIAGKAGKRDLVIVLISGGGSALMTAPVEGVELSDLKRLTEDLLESGASIGEINTVRKQLSMIKGGRLARAIHPARGLSLVLSDVVGDNLRYIASGPTVPEQSTGDDALSIMEKYSLIEKHAQLVEFIGSNRLRDKPVDRGEFSGYDIRTQVIASNEIALSAMAEKAEELDINSLIVSSRLEGESREVGQLFGQMARSVYEEGHPLTRPALLLSGGETTVTLSDGSGTGGPNQEFTLAGGQEIIGVPDSVLGAIDSDGEDGSTEIAGGLVSGEAEVSGEEINSFLRNHDSSRLLKEMNGAIITGQTGTNVNDLRLALVL